MAELWNVQGGIMRRHTRGLSAAIPPPDVDADTPGAQALTPRARGEGERPPTPVNGAAPRQPVEVGD
jgi:hypothetical protein